MAIASSVEYQKSARILLYRIVQDGKFRVPYGLLPSLTTTVHTDIYFRFVLTGTTELHSRIQDLSIRVKKLEAALQAAHATSSSNLHPLLRDEERVEITLDENVNIEVEDADPDDAELMFSMLSIEKDVTTSRMTPSYYSLWYLDGEKVWNFLYS